MKIAGIQRVSLLDYPGRVAATLFVAGCNLNCGFCYNRWMIDADAVTESLTVASLLSWLATRRDKLQGICITGGEPLMHPQLPDLIGAIRALGFDIKLDTNGTWPKRLQNLIQAKQLNYIALDLKAPLDARYAQVSGGYDVSAKVIHTLAVLRASGVPYELRTTVCPGLGKAELGAIAEAVQPEERWYLQPFRAVEGVIPEWREREALSDGALLTVAELFRGYLPLIEVRGVEAG
ncbi:MAG: anaerobic ribonucleoside-triphosphate reductase activating protein [Chloroflexi bacterium]|nr:anaerobic ribonucleoside-triphosphate reductase activating protein [Chloroflexota bacterium]